MSRCSAGVTPPRSPGTSCLTKVAACGLVQGGAGLSRMLSPPHGSSEELTGTRKGAPTAVRGGGSPRTNTTAWPACPLPIQVCGVGQRPKELGRAEKP